MNAETDAAARYFDAIAAALSGLEVFMRDDRSPLYRQGLVAQVVAVAEDIGVDAVKIGMLGSAETVAAVVESLDLVGGAPVVVDPVMISESGAVLLDEGARDALVGALLPRTTVATPNIPEARALSGAAARRGRAWSGASAASRPST